MANEDKPETSSNLEWQSPEPRPPFIRNEVRELNIWHKKIEPIIEKYDLNFHYEFQEGDFSEFHIAEVTRLEVKFCNSIYKSNPRFRSIEDIMQLAEHGVTIEKKAKSVLEAFLNEIIEEKSLLPAFLELLARNDPSTFYPNSDDIESRIAFFDDIFIPYADEIKDFQNEKSRVEIVERARRNKRIEPRKLVCIMAYDESYIGKLPELWNFFEMNLHGDICPDTRSFDSRIYIWTALFNRWTRNDILGINPNNMKNLNKKFTLHRRLEISDADGGEFIELSELDEYLSQIANISPPTALFPETNRNQDSCHIEPLVTESFPAEESRENPVDIKNWIEQISQLTLAYENEEGILVQHKPGARWESHSFDTIKLRGKKEKADIILYIESPPFIRIGSTTKNHKALKRLDQISMKLCSFLENNYDIKTPKKQKIYKKCPEEGPGVYRFLFKIKPDIDPEKLTKIETMLMKLSKEDLIKKIEKASEVYHEATEDDPKNEEVAEQILKIGCPIALKKGWLKKHQVEKLLINPYQPQD